MSDAPTRRDPYQVVTDLILEHLEKGTVPWRCPWNRETGRPANFHTGKPYRGVNSLLLGWRFCTSPWWMTYRQARERGGHVRKGEHGATIVKFGTFDAADPTGEEPIQRKKSYLRSFTVFNATQIEGITFPVSELEKPLASHERVERAEAIVRNMPNPPVVREIDTARAYYSLLRDEITMPLLGKFTSGEAFYSSLFHELTHASGHALRLARESLLTHDEFGGPVYSREELIAEIGAAFLGMEADIVSDRHEQSASYLAGWLAALKAKENRRWIVTAAGQAAKAADYILNKAAQE